MKNKTILAVGAIGVLSVISLIAVNQALDKSGFGLGNNVVVREPLQSVQRSQQHKHKMCKKREQQQDVKNAKQDRRSVGKAKSQAASSAVNPKMIACPCTNKPGNKDIKNIIACPCQRPPKNNVANMLACGCNNNRPKTSII